MEHRAWVKQKLATPKLKPNRINGQMHRYAIAILLLGLSGMPTSAASVITGEEHCVVNVASWDNLNIRSGPSSKTRIVSRKHYDSCGIMVVGNCSPQWCPVEDGHISGWVNQRYLAMVSPSLYCTVKANPVAPMAIRAYPSINSRVLVTFNKPTCGIAFLPYARGFWQKIRIQGWEGWIPRTEVSGQ
jgi:SH3-like domain-containing protein